MLHESLPRPCSTSIPCHNSSLSASVRSEPSWPVGWKTYVSVSRFSSAACALFNSLAAFFGPAITVAGTVRDSSGAPVPDASVFFEEKATSAAVDGKSKADGSFSFLTLRPGTYTVRAEKSGMRPSAPASLLLAAGEKKKVDLVLESSAAKQTPGLEGSKDASDGAKGESDRKKPAASAAM